MIGVKWAITIEYCTAWGYLPRAVALTDKLLGEHKNKISELKIIPSSNGVFEISLDHELIFSKKELGRFPEENEIEDMIKEKLG